MTGTAPRVLVDANVLLDVLTEDPVHGVRSAEALAWAVDEGAALDAVVYGEVSVGFARIEDLEAVLGDDLARLALPYEAAFLAGKAFMRYRRQGGRRGSVLPDFLIGAHAAVRGMVLLTRERGRFPDYFPALEIVRPA